MAILKATFHEVDFCSVMVSEVNHGIRQNPAAYPFHEARVERFGTALAYHKRKDHRFFNL